MNPQFRKKILASIEPSDFIGRSNELDRLRSHALHGNGGLTLLAAPLCGTSELLRHVFDNLFAEPNGVIPFYFEFRSTDVSAHAAALRYLKEFLLQAVAFRRRDPRIIDASPEICEIAELAVPADGYWVDRLIETCHSDSRLNDERSAVKNCLSSPLRAAAHGARSVVIIDALENAMRLDGGAALLEDIKDIASKAAIPLILAGKRRPLYGHLSFEYLHLNPLKFDDAGNLVENVAVKTGVAIDEKTRDLIALQTDGVADHIVSLFSSAVDKGIDLATFDRVEQVYTEEIFGGRIAKRLDARVNQCVQDASTRGLVLRLLSDTLAADGSAVSLGYWKKHLDAKSASLDEILRLLHENEIINLTSGNVEITSDRITRDYLMSRVRTEIENQPRALAVGESLAANIRSAPMLMGSHYRRSSAIGLRGFLRSLNGQKVATALIDYRGFKSEFKGAPDDVTIESSKQAADKIELPTIVYTTYASAVYPNLNELCEPERAVIAIGMSENENIVLLAAEIDSKLEASDETAAFWCDRLEMVAEQCGFTNYRIWLVASEGFSDEALAILPERKAYGSSRRQIGLLAKVLGADAQPAVETGSEYEMAVPMGEDAEMIAVRTMEEIARRHNIPQKTINQLKTAVIEACINAAEHSLSPDRKIHQSVRVDNDKITVTISNRGLRLADKMPTVETGDGGRRGWGLKLMRELMDEVRIEQTDDGTRITLTKIINPSES